MPNLCLPIVVVAFDRSHTLERMLKSLDRCRYPIPVKLIISIDGKGAKDVIGLASKFHWKHGEKELICHKKNLGLRAHILKCGQLALMYDGIILLEDDLYVAPYFYEYVLAAQTHYQDDPNISGVALYSPHYNETACLPFVPIEDGNDVYFMQLACSWGQSWLTRQWKDFANWYEHNKDLVLQEDDSLPPDVKLWPDASWKKYFIKYNIEKNKFFVYPRASYSTNFGDSGVNHSNTKLWQVPLSYGSGSPKLPGFENSFARYDACCEILPDSLKQLVIELKDYDFTVDLYGVRDKAAITTEYVISRNAISDHLFSYGREIKPHELNLIDHIPGEYFQFGKTRNLSEHTSFLGHRYRIFINYRETQSYFYSLIPDHFGAYAKNICAKPGKDADPTQSNQHPSRSARVRAFFCRVRAAGIKNSLKNMMIYTTVRLND